MVQGAWTWCAGCVYFKVAAAGLNQSQGWTCSASAQNQGATQELTCGYRDGQNLLPPHYLYVPCQSLQLV